LYITDQLDSASGEHQRPDLQRHRQRRPSSEAKGLRMRVRRTENAS
jgi:hypothetical protein